MSFASGLITSTSGSAVWTTHSENFQTDRQSGLSTPDVHVTCGIEYRNKRDEHISGNEMRVATRTPLISGNTTSERIFQPTGHYVTGVGVVQGTLVAKSGSVTRLELTSKDNCSTTSARDLILIRNEETFGGYNVVFGNFVAGESGIVNKISYDDCILDMAITPQSQVLLPTNGIMDTLCFVAATGQIVTSSPKATVSYTMFPR